MCRVASGHVGGATSDTGQLAGDTVLGDAPERGLGSSGGSGGSCKRRSRKPWVQGLGRQGESGRMQMGA